LIARPFFLGFSLLIFTTCSAFMASPARAREIHASDFNIGGMQTSLTRVRGTDRNAELGAFGIGVNRVGFGYEKPFSVRVVNVGSLALGANGLQGGIDSAVAGGLRLPAGRTHGPVIRAGLQVALFGNKYLWDSMVEAPQFHLGYQWLIPYFDLADSRKSTRPPALFDVAMKGGWILFGRHHTGDAGRREIAGSPELGYIASVHTSWIALRASYTHIFAGGGAADIDQVDAAFCALTSHFFICENLRYEQGEVRTLDGLFKRSEVSILSLTIGFNKKKGRLDD